MDSETIRAIRENRWDVANTDACLWQLAKLMQEKLSACQSMIALWTGAGESPANWRAWTASGTVATGREISTLGGSLTLLNAARLSGQVHTEAVKVTDIYKTASVSAHNIRYGMAFPLLRNDPLTRSISFSGVFYVDRRAPDAVDFSRDECALAEQLSDAVECTVALVHAHRLIEAGLPSDDAKRQIWPLLFQKLQQHQGVLSELAKDQDIVAILSSQNPDLAPTPAAVRRLIIEVGLEPMRLALQTPVSAKAKLDVLDDAIRVFGNMKNAAKAMGIDYDTFRQQHSRAQRELAKAD